MVLVPFFQGFVKLLALPIYVLSFLGYWDPICKRIFPYFLSKFSKRYNQKLHREKELLFDNLEDFTGPSRQLVLLEIGTGTGANFEFYPPGCQVVCTDPNPNFQQYLHQSMAENQHLLYERFIVAHGEDLHQVPDNSVDVVVCTLVLCSVASVPAVLKEVLRILRKVHLILKLKQNVEAIQHVPCSPPSLPRKWSPAGDAMDGLNIPYLDHKMHTLFPLLFGEEKGGAFYFLEHVAADRSSWGYFWQQIYDPTWRYLGDGCSLIRETWKDLEKAKFSELKMRHILAPLNWTPTRPHILGYAVK